MDAYRMLEELKDLSLSITYLVPITPESTKVVSLADVSHRTVEETYGQGGFVTGLFILQYKGHPSFYHTVG